MSPFKCHGQPYFTQSKDEKPVPYIANVYSGVKAGFKYFDFKNEKVDFSITLKGKAEGYFKVIIDDKEVGKVEVKPSKELATYKSEIKVEKGKHALFLEFVGKGKCDLHTIAFN